MNRHKSQRRRKKGDETKEHKSKRSSPPATLSDHDGDAEDSREEGELSDSDDEMPFDYDNPDPQRTSTTAGVFATNCLKRLEHDEQYLNIIEQAMANPDYCHAEYPHMFPEPGTILIYNSEAVKQKWKLKTFSDARSEVRCNGWSWTSSTGGKKRMRNGKFFVKVDHFQGRNKNTGDPEKEEPFSCWQYTTPNENWQLLHFVGSTNQIATGYPHGNSKTGKPYIRSCPSLLQKLMKESIDAKPTDVYKKFYDELDEEVAKNSKLLLVKGPRDQKQLENARYAALNWGRLSTNTIGNIVEMAIRLVYPGYFLPDSETPRSFIDAVGLTKTNLFVHMENPLIFEEMGKVIKETGLVMRLRYDTTFKLGDLFLSVFSWEHPYFKKNVVLGSYIHDSKRHDKHVEFFQKLWKTNKQYLNGGSFVLITDGEFHLTNVWPRLINLYYFEHLKWVPPPITPTQRRLHGNERLSYDAKIVYDFVVRRYLASFADDYSYCKETITFKIGTSEFEYSYFTTVKKGFTEFLPELIKNGTVDESLFFQVGESYHLGVKVKQVREEYLLEHEMIQVMEDNDIGTDGSIPKHLEAIEQARLIKIDNDSFELIPIFLGMLMANAHEQCIPEMIKPKFRARFIRDIDDIVDEKSFVEVYEWYLKKISENYNQLCETFVVYFGRHVDDFNKALNV